MLPMSSSCAIAIALGDAESRAPGGPSYMYLGGDFPKGKPISDWPDGKQWAWRQLSQLLIGGQGIQDYLLVFISRALVQNKTPISDWLDTSQWGLLGVVSCEARAMGIR